MTTETVDLLASDAERETVVGQLRAAYREGRLTTDELEDREARAYAARRTLALDAVLEGLPAARPLPDPIETERREPSDRVRRAVLFCWFAAISFIVAYYWTSAGLGS